MNQQTTLVVLKEKEAPHTVGTPTLLDQTLSERVQARAIKDASFRQALLCAPRHVLTREFNLALDEAITIRVVEDAPTTAVRDTPTTFTLVLPPQEISFLELADAELENAGEEALICNTTTCMDDETDLPVTTPPSSWRIACD